MTTDTTDKTNRESRLQEMGKREVQREYELAMQTLRDRSDFRPEYEHFLDILSLAIRPHEFRARMKRPLVGLYCIQTPLELVDALGFHPVRMSSGSLAIQRLSSARIPAVSCPVIKSRLAPFFATESLEQLCDLLVIPTTCDWTTKLPEMIGEKADAIHVMELPHLKESERGRTRWKEEVYALKKRLEGMAGRRLAPRALQISIAKYAKAWRAFGQLEEMKRRGAISGVWSIVLANAFMLDCVDSWVSQVGALYDRYSSSLNLDGPTVFLAGSPIYFPTLKIATLVEEAGMRIAADELCSSERNLVGAPVYEDRSEHGMLSALSDRYQLACTCPTFIDNDGRARSVLDTMLTHNIQGVIYHVLKGCHPYDIESFPFEKMIRSKGLRFIKIETDYALEDSQNILTRLEAFRGTLS